MKVATLALIEKGDKILLGYKKKGEIGKGTLIGPGGKVEKDEGIEDCLIRETKEEVGITLDKNNLEKLGVPIFYTDETPDFEVHVFLTKVFLGEPKETTDMIPDWYDIDNLPLDMMLESDREWFPKMARGAKFNARVYYQNRAEVFVKIEFLPSL